MCASATRRRTISSVLPNNAIVQELMYPQCAGQRCACQEWAAHGNLDWNVSEAAHEMGGTVGKRSKAPAARLDVKGSRLIH
ncbi:hypothetical protein E4U31_007818, partial [Claviceps sp. LM219 group G6]